MSTITMCSLSVRKIIYALVCFQAAIIFLVLVYNKEDAVAVSLEMSSGVEPERGFIDRWRKYKIHPFAVTGSKWENLSESRKVSTGMLHHSFLRVGEDIPLKHILLPQCSFYPHSSY